MALAILKCVITLFLLDYLSALPVVPDCPTLMYSSSLSALPPSFPGVVAHGVHSLTLPDIHYYFPTNKTELSMPIVNPDLLSFEPIIYQPPDFQHTFAGPAMRAVDQVLTHMNSPHYDMRLYTDLEKVVHAAHMQEIWLEAGKAYKELQETQRVGDYLCRCIRDVENNGVVRMLRLIALKLREPGLMYGEHTGVSLDRTNRNNKNDWDGNLYTYHFVDKDQETEKAAKMINDNAKVSVDQVNQNTKNDWSGNLYSYHFVDKDQRAEETAKMINAKVSLDQVKLNAKNNWNGNLYSYHFVDKDKETEEAAQKVNNDAKVSLKQVNLNAKNDWNGNLYTYHFVDKDQQTEKAAKKINKNVDAKYLAPGDGDSVKPLPHLSGPEDWETWKANMLTMKPHMDEYSKILALYMHCMLQ